MIYLYSLLHLVSMAFAIFCYFPAITEEATYFGIDLSRSVWGVMTVGGAILSSFSYIRAWRNVGPDSSKFADNIAMMLTLGVYLVILAAAIPTFVLVSTFFFAGISIGGLSGVIAVLIAIFTVSGLGRKIVVRTQS